MCLVSVTQSSAAQLGSISKFHWLNLLLWWRTYNLCWFFVFICILMCRQMVSFNVIVEQMPRAAVVAETIWPAFWSADALRSTCHCTGLPQVQWFDWGPQWINHSPSLEGYIIISAVCESRRTREYVSCVDVTQHRPGGQLQLETTPESSFMICFQFKKNTAIHGLSFIYCFYCRRYWHTTISYYFYHINITIRNIYRWKLFF